MLYWFLVANDKNFFLNGCYLLMAYALHLERQYLLVLKHGVDYQFHFLKILVVVDHDILELIQNVDDQCDFHVYQ